MISYSHHHLPLSLRISIAIASQVDWQSAYQKTYTFYSSWMREKEKEMSYCTRPRRPPENISQVITYTQPKEKYMLLLSERGRRGGKGENTQEISNLISETSEEKLSQKSSVIAMVSRIPVASGYYRKNSNTGVTACWGPD